MACEGRKLYSHLTRYEMYDRPAFLLHSVLLRLRSFYTSFTFLPPAFNAFLLPPYAHPYSLYYRLQFSRITLAYTFSVESFYSITIQFTIIYTSRRYDTSEKKSRYIYSSYIVSMYFATYRPNFIFKS